MCLERIARKRHKGKSSFQLYHVDWVMLCNFELSDTSAGSGNSICPLLSSLFGIEDKQIQTGVKSSLYPPVLQTTSISELRAMWPNQSKNVICARNIHCEMCPVFTRDIVTK